METTNQNLSLSDFGTSILAGLRLIGVTLLSDSDTDKFCAGFQAAYDVVESELGDGKLDFALRLDVNTTPCVATIVDTWLTSRLATREERGKVLRLTSITQDNARHIVRGMPGGEELWSKAARAFVKSCPGHYPPQA